jgi:hypothetical protein
MTRRSRRKTSNDSDFLWRTKLRPCTVKQVHRIYSEDDTEAMQIIFRKSHELRRTTRRPRTTYIVTNLLVDINVFSGFSTFYVKKYSTTDAENVYAPLVILSIGAG